LTTTTTTANAALPKSGGILTGDTSYGDNVKAKFGTGDDLVIYHDGSHSYIKDTATGNLRIDGTDIQVRSTAGANMAAFVTGAEVQLYHNNAKKFETTSTGIDVTGTVTADGLVVSQSSGANILLESTTTGATTGDIFGEIEFKTNDSNSAGIKGKIDSYSEGAVGNGALRLFTGDTAGLHKRQNIASNGDISFYEDTGTTPKMVWSASAEKLELTALKLYSGNVRNEDGILYVGTSGSNATQFYNNDANTMHISATGDVGLGTSSVTAGFKLEVTGDARFGDAVGDDAVELGWSAGGSTGYIQAYDRGASAFRSLNLNNAMTLDSSGNVGIGTVSPANLLHLDAGTGTTAWARFENSTNSGLIGYDNSDAWLFYNGASESMRISSAGDVLVGGTNSTPNSNNAGTTADNEMALRSDGLALFSAYKSTSGSGVVMDINRTSTDGGILGFRKDGITVGSISSRGGSSLGLILNPASGTGAGFSGTTNAIFPVNETTTPVNGVVSLGTSANAYKDLYLSGGVYLGGVGAANLLDDYEEGTWTPVLKLGGIAGTDNTASFGYANYTKVGNIVQINVSINMINTISGTGHLVITGLPFQNVSSSQMPWRANDNMNTSNVICQTTATALVFYNASASTTGGLADYTDASINSTAAGKVILVSGTYRAQ
jgi:hypothetical protein